MRRMRIAFLAGCILSQISIGQGAGTIRYWRAGHGTTNSISPRWIDGNWAQATNWAGGVAASNTDWVEFHSTNSLNPGIAYFATNNTTSGNTFAMAVRGTNVHLYGNTINANGLILSNSGFGSMSMPIKLMGASYFTNYLNNFTNKGAWNLNGYPLTLGVRAGTLRITGVVTNGSATKADVMISGAGFVNFNAAGQTYDGNTLVTNGATLQFSTDNAFPSGPGKGDIILGASVATGANVDLNSRAAVTVNGVVGQGVITNIGVTTRSILNVGAGDVSFTLGGRLTKGNRAPVDITKVGAGTMVITNFSSGMGRYTPAQGTVIFGHADAISNGVLNLVATNAGYVIFSNAAPAVGALVGQQDLGMTNIDGLPMVPLTLGMVSNWTGISAMPAIAFGGTNTYTGGLSGVGASLVMRGSNVQELLGSNTFDGPITITSGKLVLGPAHGGAGGVTVAAGGTLAVRTTSADGTLNLSALTLGNAADDTVILEFQLDNPTGRGMGVGSLIPNASSVKVNLVGAGLALGQNTLLHWDTQWASPNFVLNAFPVGLVASLSQDANNLYLNVTSLPVFQYAGFTSTQDGNPNVPDSGWTNGATANFINQSDWEGYFSTNAGLTLLAGYTNYPMSPYLDGVTAVFSDGAGTNVVDLRGAVQPGGVRVTNANDFTMNGGAYWIDGPGTLIKDGPGTFYFNVASNKYSGLTYVKNGRMVLGGNDVIPYGAGKGNLVVSNSGVVDLNGFSGGVSGLSGNGTVANSSASLSLLRMTNNATVVFDGVIQGNVRLQKSSVGSLTLNGANSYTGGTTNSNIGSVMLAGHDLAFGTGPIQLLAGTVASANTAPHTFANDLVISGNVVLGSAASNGKLTFTGGVDINSSNGVGTIARIITNPANCEVVFTGPVTNGGFAKCGAGKLTFTGNSYNFSNSTIREGTWMLAGTARMTNLGNYFRPDCIVSNSYSRLTLQAGAYLELDRSNANIYVSYDGTVGATGTTNYLDLAGTIAMPNADLTNGRVLLGRYGTPSIFNLQTGGYLAVRSVAPDGSGGTPGYAEFNWDGGTLVAMTNTPAFLQGLNNAFVRDGGAVIDTAGHNVTIAQALLAGGSGGLTKNGNGVLMLTGANTYHGPTLVNQGVLMASTAGALGSGEVVVNNSASLSLQIVNVGDTLRVGGVRFPGSATAPALNFSGLNASANPVLYATNVTVNGTVALNIASGNLEAGLAYPLVQFENPIAGSGGFVLGTMPNGVTGAHLETNGNVLTLVVDSGATAPIVWGGTDGVLPNVWDIDTTPNWSFGGNAVVYSELPLPPGAPVLFDDTASGPSEVNITANVTPSSVRVQNDSRAYVFYGAGSILGAAGLEKQGLATLTISNANYFQGGTRLGAGTIYAANSLGLGSGPVVVSNGAQLYLNCSNTVPNALTIAGEGPDGKGALYLYRLTDGQCYLAQPVTLSGDARINSTIDTTAAQGKRNLYITNGLNGHGFTVSFGGETNNVMIGSFIANQPGIGGSGTKVIKDGSMNLVLRGNNSFDGGLFINDGIVNCESNYLGVLGAGKVTLNRGVLRPSSTTSGTDRTLTNAVDVGGDFTLGWTNFSGLTFTTGDWTLLNPNRVLSVLSTVTINSPIGDKAMGFGFTRTGPAGVRFTLGGANAFSGSISNLAGILALGPQGSISNAPVIYLGAGTTFDVSAVPGALMLNAPQTLGGYGVINGSVYCPGGSQLTPGGEGVAGTLTFSNNLSLDSATLNIDGGGALNDLIAVAGNLDLAGTITVKLNQLVPGRTLLLTYGTKSGANYSWNVIASDASVLRVDESVPGEIWLVPSGLSLVVTWAGAGTNWDAVLSTNWLRDGSPSYFYNGDAVVFDVNGLNKTNVNLTTTLLPAGVTVTDSGDYFFQGPGKISGAATLEKLGSGTLTIGNNNDYSGATTVGGGILRVTAPNALGDNAGLTVVSNGAQLQLDFANTMQEPLVVAGSGPDGTGALRNYRSTTTNSILGGLVTLSGDTRIQSDWKVAGSGALYFTNGIEAAGYALTVGGSNSTLIGTAGVAGTNTPGISGSGTKLNKEGYGALWLRARSSFDGGTFINQGTVVCDSNFPGLLGSGKIALNAGTLRVGNGGAGYDRTLTNDVELNGSFSLGFGGVNVGKLIFDTGVWTINSNNLTLTINSPVTINSPIGDGGRGFGFTRAGVTTNALVLGCLNTFAGNLTNKAGILALGPAGSVSNAPIIYLATGTVLDVSAVTDGFYVASGQSLMGNGGILGAATVAAGAVLAPGDAGTAGTLNFTNDLTLGEGAMVNCDVTGLGGDQIAVGGVLTLGGTITVNVNAGTSGTTRLLTYGILVRQPGYTWKVVGQNPRMSCAIDESVPGEIRVVTTPVSLGNILVSQTSPTPTPPYATWDTAAHTIQEAVDFAVTGDTVMVDDGIYASGGRAVYGTMTNRLVVDKAITVGSVNGPAKTWIVGAGSSVGGTNGDGAIRCVYLGNAGMLSGFTLTNGHTRAVGDLVKERSGGAVWCASNDVNEVINCVLAGNSADNSGGGAMNCTIYDSVLTGNTALNGGGAAYSSLNECVLNKNRAGFYGGGGYYGAMRSCALTENYAEYGGGVAYGTANNCTLTGNSALLSGGGAYSAALNNCIVYYNLAPDGMNSHYSSLSYSCTTPAASGAGNITAEPRLAAGYLLAGDSPCIGAGNYGYTPVTDIIGNSWDIPPCMGAYQYVTSAVAGNLAMAISLPYAEVATGYALELQAVNTGLVDRTVWEFGDGTSATNLALLKHAWKAPGAYEVHLTGYNGSYPGGVMATAVVTVLARPVYYVDAGNPAPAYPYGDWSSAAATIQEAIDAGTLPGRLVLVTNGVYDSGTRAVFGMAANRVALGADLEVRSVNGPGATWIVGTPGGGGANGSGAVRCAYVGSNAILSGFTLTNGHTLAAGETYEERSAGGAFCAVSGCVSNCVISGNTAAYSGGGVLGGTASDCILADNTAIYGGGAYYVYLNSSLVVSNAGFYGGGAHHGTLVNCTLAGNFATNTGGGIFLGSMLNCISYYNTCTNGSNYYGTTNLACCTFPMPAFAGNITNPPAFVDMAAGDFHLSWSSPCLDAGDDSAVASGALDLDGNPRLSGLHVDLGAYELTVATTISAPPQDVTLYINADAVFSVTAVGTPPFAYQWFENGQVLASATNQSLVISNCQLAQNGNSYFVVVGGGFGTATSQVAHLEVVIPPAPVIVTQPASTNLFEGTALALRVEASSPLPMSYQWYFADQPLAAQTNADLALASMQLSQSGNYYVVVGNLGGAVTSQVAVVTVLANPPVIVKEPADQMVFAGAGAVFSVQAGGTEPLGYQWFTNGMPVEGATSPGVGLANCSLSQDGYTFFAVVTNAAGAVTSRVAVLTVKALPLPYITVQPAPVMVRGGGNVTFSVAATNPAPMSYQWYFTNAPLAGATNATLSWHLATTNQMGDYYAVISNDTGAVTSRVARLVVLVPGIRYVSAASTNPVLPYASWETAARTIQDAVDMALTNDVVLVTNGIYNQGGRAVYGLMTNRVAVDKALTVSSVNGAADTWIVGAGAGVTNGNGSGAVRCVYLGTNAVLNGFTLTNGHTHTSGSVIDEESGGGVLCATNGNAVLNNCRLTGNSAYYRGGGAHNGTLNNCVLVSNVVSGLTCYAGGAAFSALNGCVLTGNRVTGTTAYGGATYYGTLNNCLLDHNAAVGTSFGYGGGAYNGMLKNCTIIANSATTYGAGVRNGNLTNCIILNNTSPTGSNYYGSSIGFCCTLPITNGLGNIWSNAGFVNYAAGDYRLATGSPCIDAGSDDAVQVGALDLDVRPRIAGAHVDIGAYEYGTAPVITLQPQSQSNFVSLSATLNIEVVGIAPLSIQWYKSASGQGTWSAIEAATNAAFSINSLVLGDSGDYQCLVSNVYGSVTSSVATVTVWPTNHPPILGTVPGLVTPKNTAVTLDTVKLLLTAYDADGDGLVVSRVDATTAQGATVNLDANLIKYTPPTNYVGSDAFTYDVTDGTNTVSGTVLVTVQAVSNNNRNQIGQPLVLPGGSVQLKFVGILGVTYEIQRATSISSPTWTTLTTTTPWRNGIIYFTDTNPPPMSFYRTAVIMP